MGEALYETVSQYADFGMHRTGTDGDHATAEWFADQLRHMGAAVERQTYRFPRYDARWSLEINGAEVDSLPMFYGPAGNFDLRDVPVGTIDLTGYDEIAARRELDCLISQAQTDGATGLLVETRSNTGGVYAMNTSPDWTSDLPVMFVGNSVGAGSDNHIQLNARVVTGHVTAITGTLGKRDRSPPLIVTTPLSGWFSCAGERGTGIAMVLELAQEMSAWMPVVVIAASGHEFQYLGCRHHLASAKIDCASTVLHMGSCVATLPCASDGLSAIAHVTDGQFPVMAERLRDVGLDLTAPRDPSLPACWQGESEDWARFGCQMLSLAGVSPAFHTPDDTITTTTTPALLAEMYETILETSKAMTLI